MKRISDSDMEAQVVEFTKDYFDWQIKKDEGGGYYVLERYVDYREEFPESAIAKILKSKNPQETFWEIVDEWNMDSEDWYYQDEFFNKLEEFCEENGINFDEAKDIVFEHFYWEYPDSFLNPSFQAVIRIDNGDADYEFGLHDIFYYTADDNEELQPEAGLYWLAEQQGKLPELLQEIKKVQNGEDLGYNFETSKGFVQTSIIELNNVCTSVNALTFLTDMDLQDAINILSGKIHSITLRSNATCGLYDNWNGAGATMDIQLDKDVVIPVDKIYSIDTDDRFQDVYGMSASAWDSCIVSID